MKVYASIKKWVKKYIKNAPSSWKAKHESTIIY